jgi:nucleosome binding factor SPN SPT16 subunit
VLKIRPTKNCLIAISEFPFFVVDLDDIEAVHFERVQFGIKNFDMAIIFKDFQTFKHINSIPRESLDLVKSYLNEIGIIFSEGVVPLNWNTVLAQIREDFEAFLDEGAWKFLQEDDNEEEGEEEDPELAGDPSFEDEEESSDFGSDDESDFSDEDDYDDSDDMDDDVSEGESWEEAERRALEEDKQAARRRAAAGNAKGGMSNNRKR